MTFGEGYTYYQHSLRWLEEHGSRQFQRKFQSNIKSRRKRKLACVRNKLIFVALVVGAYNYQAVVFNKIVLDFFQSLLTYRYISLV